MDRQDGSDACKDKGKPKTVGPSSSGTDDENGANADPMEIADDGEGQMEDHCSSSDRRVSLPNNLPDAATAQEQAGGSCGDRSTLHSSGPADTADLNRYFKLDSEAMAVTCSSCRKCHGRHQASPPSHCSASSSSCSKPVVSPSLTSSSDGAGTDRQVPDLQDDDDKGLKKPWGPPPCPEVAAADLHHHHHPSRGNHHRQKVRKAASTPAESKKAPKSTAEAVAEIVALASFSTVVTIAGAPPPEGHRGLPSQDRTLPAKDDDDDNCDNNSAHESDKEHSNASSGCDVYHPILKTKKKKKSISGNLSFVHLKDNNSSSSKDKAGNSYRDNSKDNSGSNRDKAGNGGKSYRDSSVVFAAARLSLNMASTPALDNETLERQELSLADQAGGPAGGLPQGESDPDKSGDRAGKGFITQLDKDGNIEEVPMTGEEEALDQLGSNPLADFMSADILAKPFTFVAGNATRSRFNPFRKKKKGLLSVLARQSTRNRFVGKNGQLNAINSAEGNSHKFFKDIFISIIDQHWGWIFLMFAAAFYFSWLAFAVVWYLTFLQHGDFDPDNLAKMENNTFVPCVSAISDFTSCFLFSLELQHTIGFGGRATTEQCPFAVIVMSLQSILGVIIQACMAGIIFAKFTVPRNRAQTIVYSKNAVITQRNGHLYLLCRISDLRKSSLLEAHIRMVFIRKEVTDEGEVIPFQQSDLECGSEIDGSNDRVLMFWPTTLSHKIDQDSPLFEMGPRDLLTSQFEVVVTLEGVTEETGNTIQVRTSYLPNEILWGHHFDNNVVSYDKKAACFVVSHNKINQTSTDDTPRVSAKQLARRRAAGLLSNRQSSAGVSVTSDSRSDHESPHHKKVAQSSSMVNMSLPPHKVNNNVFLK